MDEERFEELLSLSIGELREMLAYEESYDTFEKFLADNGWMEDADEDYYEDTEPEEEEDDPYTCEDEVCEEEGSVELADSESEALAQAIAGDIYWGKYKLETILGLYPVEVEERIKYLI